jgi:hypothetical protein
MKYTWEEKDIVCGTIVKPAGSGGEHFIIGYMFGFDEPSKTLTMNSLSDGMVMSLGKTKEAAVRTLNDGNYVPVVISVKLMDIYKIAFAH